MVSAHQIVALVEQLEHKIELLKGSYEEARKQLQQLERENTVLRESLREQQTLVKQLEKKQVNSEKNVPKSKHFGKIVKDNLSRTDTNTELKQQLDEYIQEVERCIAHLSSLS